MLYQPSTSVFSSVRQYFGDARIEEEVLVATELDTNAARPARLTPAEAYEALYGPGTDARLSTAIWDAVLSAARADLAPHGTARLLVVWLALPRLAGTVHRICRRLHADQSDVEAEMVLALLEELSAPGCYLSADGLIQAARARAWHFARVGLRETASAQVEHIAQDRALSAAERTDGSARQEAMEVRVDRPEGPGGLRASLCFRVARERLRDDVFAGLEDGTRGLEADRRPRKRRSRRRVGTLQLRPVARRP
ncbi:hypothetical protein [Streptomyces achromogenes]|uniref:hypothetical protein n=1 Tax=Streptomyces achromogenes TaxID=67255 RepID=UPI0036C53072